MKKKKYATKRETLHEFCQDAECPSVAAGGCPPHPCLYSCGWHLHQISRESVVVEMCTDPFLSPREEKCHLCSFLKKNIFKILQWLWKEKLFHGAFPEIPSSSQTAWHSSFIASVLAVIWTGKQFHCPASHVGSLYFRQCKLSMGLCLRAVWFCNCFFMF